MELEEYEKMYRFEENYWWWAGKRKIVKRILESLKPDCDRILDIGCGTGANLEYLGDYGMVVGLDFSREALDFSKMREHENLVQGDAERLPFRDDSFDLITGLDIIEHIDDGRASRGFVEALKNNGLLLLTVPAYSFLWSKHDEALHHRRRYSKNQLRRVLEENGFTIEKMSYWNSFLFIPVAVTRLVKRYVIRSREVKTDVGELPSIINGLLTFIMTVESCLIRRIDLPFGVSIVCLARVTK